jgi:hypothetical protein
MHDYDLVFKRLAFFIGFLEAPRYLYLVVCSFCLIKCPPSPVANIYLRFSLTAYLIRLHHFTRLCMRSIKRKKFTRFIFENFGSILRQVTLSQWPTNHVFTQAGASSSSPVHKGALHDNYLPTQYNYSITNLLEFK